MGQLHRHGREKYHSGYASRLFRVSAAHLPLQGRSVKFGRIRSGARQPRLGKAPSRPANTVLGHMGELDRRFPMSPLFLFAHFWKRQQGNFRIRDGGIENGRPKRTRLNRHRLKESQSRPAPAFAHLPQIAPFMRRPFLHLNQGQLTGNAQNSKRSFLKSASPY